MFQKFQTARPIYRQLLVTAIVMLLGALRAGATITVHDLSENTSTGVYTYLVTLDGAANVQAGDGFVIYDFPGLLTNAISGGLSTSQFTLTQTLTSNVLNKASSVDAVADVTAVANGITFDSAAIDNLNFSYVGPPTSFLGATTATLTLTSSLHGADTASVDGSVDNSGPSASFPYAFSSNPVTVPAVPEPATLTLLAMSGVPLMARRHKRIA